MTSGPEREQEIRARLATRWTDARAYGDYAVRAGDDLDYLLGAVSRLRTDLGEEREARQMLDEELNRVSGLLAAHSESSHSTVSAHLADVLAELVASRAALQSATERWGEFASAQIGGRSWTCPDCNATNISERIGCHNCTYERPSGSPGAVSPAAPDASPSADERAGMDWFNGLSFDDRSDWLRRANTASAAEAWSCFKRTVIGDEDGDKK